MTQYNGKQFSHTVVTHYRNALMFPLASFSNTVFLLQKKEEKPDGVYEVQYNHFLMNAECVDLSAFVTSFVILSLIRL